MVNLLRRPVVVPSPHVRRDLVPRAAGPGAPPQRAGVQLVGGRARRVHVRVGLPAGGGPGA